MEEKLCCLALNEVDNLGSIKCYRLFKHFGSAVNIWHATEKELGNSGILDKRSLENLLNMREKPLKEENLEIILDKGIDVITINEKLYPKDLLNMADPPLVLYVKGEIPSSICVAIVGSRKVSAYGLAIAEQLGYGLAGENITVVSGLARGIDTAAHKGALKAKNGKTIAVLGCGIDVYYPPENKLLYKKISENGCLISEFPLGTVPNRGNFPRRNRLISGLSSGITVVSSRISGGAMITADLALEQGKEVFAVPGLVTGEEFRGSHKLIKEGAKLVENVSDILDELGLKGAISPVRNLSEDEKVIIDYLRNNQPVIYDDLFINSGLSMSAFFRVITSLEMKGYIAKTRDSQYITCI